MPEIPPVPDGRGYDFGIDFLEALPENRRKIPEDIVNVNGDLLPHGK
jgi:hypothetical protein